MAAYRRGFMTHIICRLTAKNRDQLRNPTLCNRVRATFIFYTNTHTYLLTYCDAAEKLISRDLMGLEGYKLDDMVQ